MNHTGYNTPEKSSLGMTVLTSLQSKQPGGPSDTNRCFICESSNHFARECPQARQQNKGQGSSQTNKNKRKRRTNKSKRRVDQVGQGRINLTTLVELPKGAPEMMGTFSLPTSLAP